MESTAKCGHPCAQCLIQRKCKRNENMQQRMSWETNRYCWQWGNYILIVDIRLECACWLCYFAEQTCFTTALNINIRYSFSGSWIFRKIIQSLVCWNHKEKSISIFIFVIMRGTLATGLPVSLIRKEILDSTAWCTTPYLETVGEYEHRETKVNWVSDRCANWEFERWARR